MQETIQSFTDYLQTEKKASKNTEVSYQRDLRKLAVFLKEHGIEKPEQMNATVLNSYLLSGAGTLLACNDLAQHRGNPHVLPICVSGGDNGIRPVKSIAATEG